MKKRSYGLNWCKKNLFIAFLLFSTVTMHAMEISSWLSLSYWLPNVKVEVDESEEIKMLKQEQRSLESALKLDLSTRFSNYISPTTYQFDLPRLVQENPTMFLKAMYHGMFFGWELLKEEFGSDPVLLEYVQTSSD